MPISTTTAAIKHWNLRRRHSWWEKPSSSRVVAAIPADCVCVLAELCWPLCYTCWPHPLCALCLPLLVSGTLVGSFPCVQGTNRTCYSSPGSRFKACCTTPRISMCKVNSVVQLPNNQVPWTMVHGGLKLMMSRAITLMNSTWSFGNGNTPAGDVITCQTHSSKQRGK